MNYVFEENKKMLAKIRRYPAILGRIILKCSNKLSTNRILQLHTMKSVCKTLCKTSVDSSQLIYITGYLLCTLVSITIYELHHIVWRYIALNQEIIKVRECISHIGLIPKVIPL